jgi:hypothetical protein
VARLLDAAGEELALFLRLAALTGARRGQLCALQWRDIDLEHLASIHRSAWGDGRGRRLRSEVDVGWAVSPVGVRGSGVTSLATMVCQRVVVVGGRAGPLWLFKSAGAASGCGPVPC